MQRRKDLLLRRGKVQKPCTAVQPQLPEEARQSPVAESTSLSEKADDYDNISQSVEKASSFVGGLWITFISVGAYLAVAAASVTHVQLFHETPIKLPLLDASLPLVAFFWFMPCFFTVIHFYLLIQTSVLSDKISRLNEVLSSAGLDAVARHKIRQLLPNDLLVQSLAGPLDRRQGFTGQMFRVAAWLTMVAGPAAILLLFQYKFLPFQSEPVTWIHRFTLTVDIACVCFWWLPAGAPMRSDEKTPSGLLKNGLAAVAVLILSFVALTFPGELLDSFEPQQRFHVLFSAQIPDEDMNAEERSNRDQQSFVGRTFKGLLPLLSSRDRELEPWLREVPEARRLVAGNLRLPEAELIEDAKSRDDQSPSSTTEVNWESTRTASFSPSNYPPLALGLEL